MCLVPASAFLLKLFLKQINTPIIEKNLGVKPLPLRESVLTHAASERRSAVRKHPFAASSERRSAKLEHPFALSSERRSAKLEHPTILFKNSRVLN